MRNFSNVMKKIFVLSYFLLLAVIVRWPLSIYLDAVPLEPNFPLHALAALDLSIDGTPFLNQHLEWPTGAPVRYLAWPLLLIGIPLERFFSSVEAFNLATLLWIWGQGIGVYWLFSKWFRSEFQRFSGATLAIIAPQSLIALGNGQFENFAPFFLLLCFWAAQERRFILCTIGLLACCFSSPYIGFLALLLVFITARFQPKMLLALGLSASLTFIYYQPVSSKDVHESTMAAPTDYPEVATIQHLFIPSNKALSSGTEIMSAKTRWNKIFSKPQAQDYDNRWAWLLASSSNFMGFSFLIFGCWGLIANRRTELQPLIIWGILSTLFAFGSSVDLGFIELPFLWKVSHILPGLANMQATSRFLFATSLLLTFGVCLFPHRKWLPLILVISMLETFFITPAHWPIPSKDLQLSKELQEINAPIAFWPAAPSLSSHKVTMLSLVLEQPLALFSDMEATMPDRKGHYNAGRGRNRQGQTLQEWNTLIKERTNLMLQFRGDFETNKNPLTDYHHQQCFSSYCRWYFNPNKPKD